MVMMPPICVISFVRFARRLPFVEFIGAFFGDASQRRGEFRLLESVTGLIELSVVQENMFAAVELVESLLANRAATWPACR